MGNLRWAKGGSGRAPGPVVFPGLGGGYPCALNVFLRPIPHIYFINIFCNHPNLTEAFTWEIYHALGNIWILAPALPILRIMLCLITMVRDD